MISIVSTPTVIISPSGPIQGAMVSSPHVINCTVVQLVEWSPVQLFTVLFILRSLCILATSVVVWIPNSSALDFMFVVDEICCLLCPYYAGIMPYTFQHLLC